MKRIAHISQFVYLPVFIWLMAGCGSSNTGEISQEKYIWKNVQIVGGGFVDGFVFHPTEDNLVYARTDMGGAYRREGVDGKWVPLMDWVSYDDRNLMGVESIALDPNEPDKVYMACGTYTNESSPTGEIFRSDDRGETFERTPVPFKMGGNENGRGNGERMTVDPNSGDILYLGTRHDGLWKSIDGAVSWNKVESFPDVSETMPDTITDRRFQRYWRFALSGSGVVVTLCDPNSGEPGQGSSTVYALVSLMNRDNFFRSTNGGETWEPVSGHPQQYRPNHAVLTKNGMMYISYGDNPGPWRMRNGGVWAFNTKTGDWKDITPEKPIPGNDNHAMGYASVAVDPQHPDTIVASSFYRSGSKGGEEIFVSADGGETWKGVYASGGTFDYSKAPYVKHTGIHWLFDIEVNPANPDHVIFTTGYGGHESFNFTNLFEGEPTVWEVMSTGIEETVPLELLSPPKGPHLVTAIGDYGGFVHWDLDRPAPEGNFVNPHFGNTDGVACAALRPDTLVRVGVASHQRSHNANIGYSFDMGETWQPTDSVPTDKSAHGHIAVSALGDTWIWNPQQSKPYRTTDMGKSWTEIDALPANTRVQADKINNNRFYGLNLKKGVYYVSTDGGETFEAIESGLDPVDEESGGRGDARGGQDRIYATPGIENELWIAAFDGLYLKKGAENTFSQKPYVEEIHGFGFGKAAPDEEYLALYLIGTINGQRGIFRSDDEAESWVRVNDDAHEWGLLLHIIGDPKKYGRVYVGTHGRGAIYGDPM